MPTKRKLHIQTLTMNFDRLSKNDQAPLQHNTICCTTIYSTRHSESTYCIHHAIQNSDGCNKVIRAKGCQIIFQSLYIYNLIQFKTDRQTETEAVDSLHRHIDTQMDKQKLLWKK